MKNLNYYSIHYIDISEIKKQTDVFEIIINIICKKFEISSDALLCRNRILELKKPRYFAACLLFELTTETATKIAKFFGGRKHQFINTAFKFISTDKFDEELYINIRTKLLSDNCNLKLYKKL